MANDKINQSENILVTVDQQNIIHIDPNSIVDSNGQIQSRLVDHENLVMYVNLEADLVPRTTFYADGQQSTLLSIAEGSFNLLRNQGDKNEFENNLDTNWTETFVSRKNVGLNRTTGGEAVYDPTAQTFGIQNITIITKGVNNIPQITINFLDVRGKTLFEAPANSPYSAFFHQPWPIFYLTVKGYYGKAIRYRIQMVDFKSKFNGSTGNFEIIAKFVGSSYAFLNDILFQNAVNAPFMYMVEKQDEPYRVNEKTGLIEKKISKTTKGFSILKSIYSDYKAKGYIPQDFPDKTLRDLIMTAKSLDKIIEAQLFSETVDPTVLTHVAEFDALLDSFERSIVSWGNRNLNSTENEVKTETITNSDGTQTVYKYYRLIKALNDQTKLTNGPISSDIITNGENKKSLQYLINFFIANSEKNTAFGKKSSERAKKSNGEDFTITTTPISIDRIRNIGDFYTLENGTYGVAIEKLVNEIKAIQATFITSRNSVELKIEEEMNKVIQNPNMGGFGFKPTIRNIFAVILANADTYIRLMKDVHQKAIQKSNERKGNLVKPTDKNKDEYFYPWPEILKKDDSERDVSFYPADPAIVSDTKGNDFSLWPEVEFIETYNSVATKRVDPLTGTEIDSSDLSFIFDNDQERRNVKKISTLFEIDRVIPYTDKSIINVLYEIYERAFYVTSYNNFQYGKGLEEIVNAEFETLKSSLENDIDIKDLIKNQVKTVNGETNSLLYTLRTKERFPFFQNKLSTVEYIKELVDQDFEIIDYTASNNNTATSTEHPNLQAAINDYSIEEYRLYEFPFGSDLYKQYLKKSLSASDYKFKNVFSINVNDSFISSPVKPEAWLQLGFDQNIFSNKIKLTAINSSGDSVDFYENLLNTPYFHKQLYNDFLKGGVANRYVGSAYLLLNSLPYKDLDDEIDFNGNKVLISSLFKEISATHFVPYHLLLKWGSQYHRYKRYLKDGVDIISGATTSISGSTFFDNATNVTFNLSGITAPMTAVTYNSNEYIGLYPYYFGIFHQITNGYSFYNPSGFTEVSASTTNVTQLYADTVTSGITKYSVNKTSGGPGYSLTSFVDNSIFSVNDTRYTVLPSSQIFSDVKNLTTNFNYFEQDSFKIILNNPGVYDTLTPYNTFTMPSYGETFKNVDGVYSLIGEQRKFVDLIATFSPALLDKMEEMFLAFSSLNLQIDTKNTVQDYKTFQGLLKAVCSISKENIDFSNDNHKLNIIQNQEKNLEQITKNLLSNENLKVLRLGNPKQIDDYTLFGFIGDSQNYSLGSYNASQLTASNLNLIKLYIGEEAYTGTTPTTYYRDFFSLADIEINEENIINHRELARIYAGWAKRQTTTITKTTFVNYIKTQITEPEKTRLFNYLSNLVVKLQSKDFQVNNDQNNKITIYHGFNEAKTTKLDLYQFFKSFNDKWISGNAIGQRHLMDEFLFLDKANRDIGDDAYISLERLISLSDEKNIKVDLYSAVSILIQGTNFDMRPLPAYINFYGTNSSNKSRITPSKNLAKNLFGTHLDVDYQDATPKIILQYVNGTSKYLDMQRVNKKFKFKNDGFDIKDTTRNPLLVEPKIFMDADLSKSNRVVSFEINFGDYSQGIFKEISLDQSTYKNTTESALAQERLARSQGGGGTHQVDIGLFDIYKTASYQCTVKMMGNVMIQPTMYFYLANVPMFEGTYLVFDVTHSISDNTIETTLTGVRLSNSSLPNLENSFMASYRPLFSKLLSSAIRKKQQIDSQQTTEKTITLPNSESANINPGNELAGEDLYKKLVYTSGFYQEMIPYNGAKYNGKEEKYVQLIDLGGNNNQWLRARVVRMGGTNNPIDDKVAMDLISGLSSTENIIKKWENIKNSLGEYYSVRLNGSQANKEKLLNYKTEFLNPRTNAKYTLVSTRDATTNLYNGPVLNGPDQSIGNYGIGMNSMLMRKLKVNEGDVVYFRLI